MRLLPATPLAQLLDGYFLYTRTPVEVGEEEDNECPRHIVEDRDPVDIIMVGFSLRSATLQSLKSC